GYDPDADDLAVLAAARGLCTDGLQRSGLAEVPAAVRPEPNNVLLRDRDYSRLWRAWLWVRGLDDELAAAWAAAEQRFRAAAFVAAVVRLAREPGGRPGDQLALGGRVS